MRVPFEFSDGLRLHLSDEVGAHAFDTSQHPQMFLLAALTPIIFSTTFVIISITVAYSHSTNNTGRSYDLSVQVIPQVILPAGQIRLKELEAVDVVLLVLDPFELGQILADFIADGQLPVRCHNLVVLLVLELLLAQGVVASDLAALLLMAVDL